MSDKGLMGGDDGIILEGINRKSSAIDPDARVSPWVENCRLRTKGLLQRRRGSAKGSQDFGAGDWRSMVFMDSLDGTGYKAVAVDFLTGKLINTPAIGGRVNYIYAAISNKLIAITSADTLSLSVSTIGSGISDKYALGRSPTGVFVVGGSANASYSSDLSTFTNVDIFGLGGICNLDYVRSNGARIIAAGWRGALYPGTGSIGTSTDGITWAPVTMPFSTINVLYVYYDGTRWLLPTANGRLIESTDGINFTANATHFATGEAHGIMYFKGLWISYGQYGRIYTSPDRIVWTSRANPWGTSSGDFIYCGDCNESIAMVTGTGGKVATSTDGIVWSASASPMSASETAWASDYIGGYFWISSTTATSPNISRSVDGTSWETVSTGIISSLAPTQFILG